MMKLLGLGVPALLAALIYGQADSESSLPPFHAAEQADRIFLAEMESQEAVQSEDAEILELKTRAELVATRPIPVAIAVVTPLPARVATLHPNRPMDRSRLASSTAISPPEGAPHSQPAPPVIRGTTPAGPVTEVRRAIPVLPHRATIVITGDAVSVHPAPQ